MSGGFHSPVPKAPLPTKTSSTTNLFLKTKDSTASNILKSATPGRADVYNFFASEFYEGPLETTSKFEQNLGNNDDPLSKHFSQLEESELLITGDRQ